MFSNRVSLRLDYLRGLAILGVVMVHVNQIMATRNRTPNDKFLINYLDYGKYGVELFFAISGFLLTSIYSNRKTFSVQSFAKRRFWRIFPLWFAFLTYHFVYYRITGNGNWKKVKEADINMPTIFQNDFVIFLLGVLFLLWISGSLWNSVIDGGWSIQSEVLHYVIFPILMRIRLIKIVFLLLVVNVFSLFFSALDIQKTEFINYLFTTWYRVSLNSTFGWFLLGIIISKIYAKGAKSRTDFINMNVIHKVIYILFFISFMLVPIPFGRQYEAVGVCLIAYLICIKVGLNSNVSTLIRKIGQTSYFIYFIHFFVISTINYSMKRYQIYFDGNLQFVGLILVFSLTLLVSQLLAMISWKFLERPLIAFGR